MGRTTIQLISSGDIEMYDDVSTPLTFNIADIRNPDKRNSNYSKTITIPGTKNNHLLFGNIFDVNVVDGSFNPNLKVRASLLIDGEEQINGHLQMLNVNIDDESKIEYEVCIKGNVGSIFTELGNSELVDLDFSEFNHTYDYATQVASWTNTYGQGYCYPLIDYGFDGDLSKVDVEHLFPAIFLKTYLLKIFQSVGYSFTSTFFDSPFFQNLIVPANSGKIILTDAQIAPRLFEATETVPSVGTLVVMTTNDTGFFDVIYDTEVNDPSGQYNPVTSKLVIDKAGYYNIYANNNATTSTVVPPGGPSVGYMFYEIYRIPISGAAPYHLSSTAGYVPNNGTFGIVTNTGNVYLDQGDIISVRARFQVITGSTVTGTISLNDGVFKNTVSNVGIIEGDAITLNQCVPNKIKQKDLLLNVIKMFNLYVDVDKNDDKNLIIESRDNFYAGGTNSDWSEKLDNSKKVQYTPMGHLDFREFNYTYTDDTDYYNKKYKDTYAETYGRYRKVVDNDFLASTSETKVIFSATPLVGDTSSNRVISRIWDVDASMAVKSKAFNIRLLYNGGVLTSDVAYDYKGRFTGTTSNFQYLYAGHVDLPSLPTVDLCFGVPQEIFYYTNYYTNNNIYNAYHKKFVDEITDRDSKIVTAYFYLKPSDIRNLDFRNQFWFENQYFRLNKIYDYDPLKNQTTKCEFVKIKDAGTFTASIATMLGGYAVGFGSEIAPIMSETGSGVVNNLTPVGAARSMLAGSGNTLDAGLRNFIALGNNNFIGNSENVALLGSSGNIIGSDCLNIAILNSSGCTVIGGTRNVTLINSSGLTIEESDIIYINGVKAPTEGTWTPTLTSVANISNSAAYLSQYFRVGNIVNCFGRVDLQATLTATTTRLGISLPIPSDFTLNYDCSGTGQAPAVAGMSVAVRGDTTNDRAEIAFTSNDTSSQQVFFHFSYVVK